MCHHHLVGCSFSGVRAVCILGLYPQTFELDVQAETQAQHRLGRIQQPSHRPTAVGLPFAHIHLALLNEMTCQTDLLCSCMESRTLQPDPFVAHNWSVKPRSNVVWDNWGPIITVSAALWTHRWAIGGQHSFAGQAESAVQRFAGLLLQCWNHGEQCLQYQRRRRRIRNYSFAERHRYSWRTKATHMSIPFGAAYTVQLLERVCWRHWVFRNII